MIPRIPGDPGFYSVTFGRHQWILRPVGDETEDIVHDLATIMSLSRGNYGRIFFITVQNEGKQLFSFPSEKNPHICYVPSGESANIRLAQISSCATQIAFQLLPYGGFLIHGALIEKDGYGFILAASSGTGKTTASQRIPPPWHGLSDDTSLIVYDESEGYIAFPWPTWGQSYDNGPTGMWDTQKAVKLEALFFLHQSSEDSISPIDKTQSTAWVMECLRHVSPLPFNRIGGSAILKKINNLELIAAEQFVRSIPTYILHISLTGSFWEEIDQILSQQTCFHNSEDTDRDKQVKLKKIPDSDSSAFKAMFGTGNAIVVHSGTDMNPTLQEQDILDIVPYNGREPSVGDIICFVNPEGNKKIIRRVIRKEDHGAWLLGDNCNIAYIKLVLYGLIIGRVTYAIREDTILPIRSGWIGRVMKIKVQVKKEIITRISIISHKRIPFHICKRKITSFIHLFYKPKIFLFISPNWIVLKILIGSYTIGHYSSKKSTWMIQSPFHVLVDLNNLPTLQCASGVFWIERGKTGPIDDHE